MAYSTQRAVSDGTLTVLGLSIQFFDQKDILVFVNEVPQIEGPAPGGQYIWLSYNTIKFHAPVPNGLEVLLRRETARGEPRHIFDQGSPFNYGTLDEDFRQILFISQEAIEGSNVGDIYTTLNMHGNRIINIGTATQPGDAVSLGQYQADANGAYQSRLAAEAARNAAQASQGAAAASEAASAASASASAGSAGASAASASASAGSATASANSASASAGSASLAQAWAVQLGSMVGGIDYSAKYWAQDAKVWAIGAAASATTATNEADRAKTEADKLQNWNALAGTVKAVNGTNVDWYGRHSFGGEVVVSQVGANNPGYAITNTAGSYAVALRLRTADNIVLLEDSAGVTRASFRPSGAFTANSSVTAVTEVTSGNGSLVTRAAAAGDNSHVWFQGPGSTARAVIYAGNDGRLVFQSAGTGALLLGSDGALNLNNGAKLQGDGNIVASWLSGGSLFSELQYTATGPRKSRQRVARAKDTPYTNPGPGPRRVIVRWQQDSGNEIRLMVGADEWDYGRQQSVAGGGVLTADVPPGATYSVTGGNPIVWWDEYL